MRRVVLVLGIVASACGNAGSSGAGGPASPTTLLVGGTLPLIATSAVVVVGGSTCQVGGASAGVGYAALVASDQTGLCAYLQQNQDRAGARAIEVLVVRVDPAAGTTAVTPDTYPIVSSPTPERSYALLLVSQKDALCEASDVWGTSGVVIVTAAGGGVFQGSITATLSDGGSVMGPFDADACAAALAGDVCTGSVGLANPGCAP